MTYVRGNVYWADLGAGRKPWLVVSTNARKNALGSALVVRITATVKPPLVSIVELRPGIDPLTGRFLCDDITVIYPDDPADHAGALSAQTMRDVGRALTFALAF